MDNFVSSRDIIKCLMCYDAPCKNACQNGVDPAKILRSIRFANYKGALNNSNSACINCDGPCQKACIMGDDLKLSRIMKQCYQAKEMDYKKADIKSDICGIEIENPFLLSSSVVASTYDMCKRAFEAGWAGVAFKTICMMDIVEASPRFSAVKGLDGSIQAFKNIEQLSVHSVIENMEI